MKPILFEVGSYPVSAYAICVLIAFVVGGLIRRAEVHRLGYHRNPAHVWVGLGGLMGAIVGAKLGMLLFEPIDAFGSTLSQMLSLDFTGKTVLGGIAGGYVGVELIKRVVGIRHSTGDGFAIALPVAQAIGRFGCFLNGCCYGEPWEGPWAVMMHGALRHPSQIYEVALDLSLAGMLVLWRTKPLPEGHLFRRYIVGYALIRFMLDPLRGDPVVMLGPLSAVQVSCSLVAVAFTALIIRGEWGRIPDSQ